MKKNKKNKRRRTIACISNAQRILVTGGGGFLGGGHCKGVGGTVGMRLQVFRGVFYPELHRWQVRQIQG